MWARVEVLDNPQSPSYPALAYLSPSRAILPGQAGNPFGVPLLWLGRPLGSAFPSPLATRDNDHLRGALEIDGEIGSYHFNAALTHSVYNAELVQPDTSTSRLDDAIAGSGGPNGNESWNLFDPLANSHSLIDYISTAEERDIKTSLSVVDFVVDGEMGSFNFASGIQVRGESLDVSRNDASLVEFDAAGNLSKPADLLFLGGGVNVDKSRSAWAVFSEFQRDLTDSFEIKFAGRYENLDSGSTFDPKLSARFQASDNLVLRASASTSYREASLYQLYNSAVSLQGIQDFNADGTTKGTPVFIRVAQNSNADLQAEEADNINIGAVWNPNDNLQITLDYWAVDYTDLITIESAQGKVIADTASATDTPDPEVIRTSAGDLVGVTTNYFNAANVTTDGVDLALAYSFPENNLGEFSFTLNASHYLSYKIPAGSKEIDIVGLFNHDNFARSLPDTKANASLSWVDGAHNASLTARHIAGYKTTRANPPAGYSQNIDSHLTWDAQYNYQLSADSLETQITLGILNLTDQEPPLVWDSVNFSYDPRQHDARGRMAYVRLKFAF